MEKNKDRYVIVTTDKDRRGVFFGKIVSQENDPNEITWTVELEEAQMVVYWAASVKGLLGLAANGANEECKITSEVPKLKINGVTAIIDVAEGVLETFKKNYWAE